MYLAPFGGVPPEGAVGRAAARLVVRGTPGDLAEPVVEPAPLVAGAVDATGLDGQAAYPRTLQQEEPEGRAQQGKELKKVHKKRHDNIPKFIPEIRQVIILLHLKSRIVRVLTRSKPCSCVIS